MVESQRMAQSIPVGPRGDRVPEAGFDTPALRFLSLVQHTRIFELDAPITQQAKIQQYGRHRLSIPPNVVLVAIDFDRESLPDRLDAAGFQRDQRNLFVLEGLLMYLEPESVRATFRTIQKYAGPGSWIIFDYVQDSVLRHENKLYGEEGLVQMVARSGEQWRFGLEPEEVDSFLATHCFDVSDHKDAQQLEAIYFTDPNGRLVGRVDGTHCLVTAVRR